MQTYNGFYKSPIGLIEIKGTSEGVYFVGFNEQVATGWERNQHITNCIKQLDEYFIGQRINFHVPLTQKGTAFQRIVWQQLVSIPYGTTSTYSDIANIIGNRKASRAVGMANARNQLAILIPCHRVIGKKGDLTGYAWGNWRKEWLLKHEQEVKSRISQKS